MRRLLSFSLFAAVVLVVLLVPSRPASAAGRCAPRAHERVVVRSSAATVTLRRSRVLVGCSNASGRRRTIDRLPDNEDIVFEQIRLHGTWIAYVITDIRGVDGGQRLFRSDAVRSGRREVLDGNLASHVVIGAGGVVAWVGSGSPAQVLQVSRPGAETIQADAGFVLTRVRLDGHRLSWRHDGAGRSADLAAPDRCGGGFGNLVLAVQVDSAPASVTACVRATGRRTTWPSAAPLSVAANGGWIAMVDAAGTGIVRADLITGTAETVPADRVDGLAISASGRLAWTQPADPATHRQPVLVHDANGTRTLDPADDIINFGFDGETLRYGTKTARLA
jgi:hypothetical protein